jgi:hypothetical protein
MVLQKDTNDLINNNQNGGATIEMLKHEINMLKNRISALENK